MRRAIGWLCLLLLLSGPAAASAKDDFDRGVSAYERGQFSKAATLFKSAVRKDGSSAEYRLWLGMTYYRQGKLDQAAEELERAAKLDGGRTEVTESAERNLALLRAKAPASTPAALPSPTPRTASQKMSESEESAGHSASDWKLLGPVEGLLGTDWYVRGTKHCKVWVRKEDKPYLEEVVAGLDGSYEENARLMGFRAKVPLEFYFFPMAEPAHTQPRFAERLAGNTRFMGLALGGSRTCVVNLGYGRFSQIYQPWEIAETACHEMNHLFAFQLGWDDRGGSSGWLFEAMAHTAEETAKPAVSRIDLSAMKSFMKGYRAQDASWAAMTDERNRDDLEQYREYSKLLQSIVLFFQARYGDDAIARLMAAARDAELEDAFGEVFGKGAAALEEEWKQFYGIR